MSAMRGRRGGEHSRCHQRKEGGDTVSAIGGRRAGDAVSVTLTVSESSFHSRAVLGPRELDVRTRLVIWVP